MPLLAWTVEEREGKHASTSEQWVAEVYTQHRRVFDYSRQTRGLSFTYRFMWKPLVSDDNFGMRLQPRLNPPALPVPKYDIALAISATDPLAVR